MATRKFYKEKLVRDKVVEMFKAKGVKVKYDTIEDNEDYLELLTQKIVEELEEVFSCESREEAIEELADLDEVIAAFKKLVEVTEEEVAAARKKKAEKYGLFDRRHYIDYIEAVEGTKECDEYLADPERYPEVSTLMGEEDDQDQE